MPKPKKQIFFSFDVETDGPIPAVNSMLSLGCAAFNQDGGFLSAYSENFEFLPGSIPDAKTAQFWSLNPEAYKAARENAIDPKVGMEAFVGWVDNLCDEHDASPVAVAFPAGFDFTWLYWYMMKFTDYSPFSWSCLDMKTLAAEKLQIPYREAKKSNFPGSWFGDEKHTHIAIDDAIEQGRMFFRMRWHKKGQ